MKLLQILNEASDLDLDAVKAALKKDKNTKILFKKDSTLADVEDKAKFIQTLKFLMLNNKKVLAFVKSRSMDPAPGQKNSWGAVKNISSAELSKYRSIKADELDEHDFQMLKTIVKDTFSEHGDVTSGKMSTKTKKEIEEWVNGNNRWHSLSAPAQRELESIESLKPNKKVVLYRGILFKKYDLEKRTRYDGVTEEGNGLKFLKQIREGSKTIDLNWDRPSSWTTSKQIATQFAKYGPAESNFSATLQWLERGSNAIDGELGYVIAIHANPSDVLVDISKIRQAMNAQHGDEGELILKPGKYLGKIVSKYTVKGEVSDEEQAEIDKNGSELVNQIYADIEKIGKLKIDELASKVPTTNLYNTPHLRETTFEAHDFDTLMNPAKLKVLVRLKSETNAVFEKYQALLKDIDEKYSHLDITGDMVSAMDDEGQKKIKIIRKFMERVKETIKSQHFEKTGMKGPIHSAPIDKVRTAIGSPSQIKELTDRLRFSSDPRISDKELGRWFNTRYEELTGKGLSSRFDMLGSAKQDPAVMMVIKDIFDKAGINGLKADKKGMLEDFRDLVRSIYRNLTLISKMKYSHDVIFGEDAGR